MPTTPNPADRLASLHAELVATIRANGEASVGRVTRIILDGLDEQARKLLRKIEDDQRAEAAGMDMRLSTLSIYGGEPAVRDIIRQAARHRETLAQTPDRIADYREGAVKVAA